MKLKIQFPRQECCFLAIWAVLACSATTYAQNSPASVPTEQATPTAWLGFYVEDTGDGVAIVADEQETPAATDIPFLRNGRLLELNGESIKTTAQYYERLAAIPVGDGVEIVVWDGWDRATETYFVYTVAAPPDIAAFRAGVVAAAHGQIATAHRFYSRTLALLAESGTAGDGFLSPHAYKEERVHEAIADAYRLQGKAKEAEAHYLAALDLAPGAQGFYTFFEGVAHPDLLIRARLWRKLGELYTKQGDAALAWTAYEEMHATLEEEGFFNVSIALSRTRLEQSAMTSEQRGRIEERLGRLYRRIGHQLLAQRYFLLAAEDAHVAGDSMTEVSALAGLAALAYASGDQMQFDAWLSRVLALPGSDPATTRRMVVDAVALDEIKQLVQAYKPEGFDAPYVPSEHLSSITLYRRLEANVDGDEQVEVLLAGGTTVEWGVGVGLLFDWQDNQLRHYVLGDIIEGFQTLYVRDVNQDARLEILLAYRIGSSAVLTVYILSFDGAQVVARWSPALARAAGLTYGSYTHGLFDFKDGDADGTDELWLWDAIWADDECNACPHRFDIHILVWDGAHYRLQEQLHTEDRLSPGAVSGRTEVFSLFNQPIDRARNLTVADMEAETVRRQAAGTVDRSFVLELIGRSDSFWRDGFFAESEQSARLALRATATIADPTERVVTLGVANAYVADSLRDQGQRREAAAHYQTAIELLDQGFAQPAPDQTSEQRAALHSILLHVLNAAGANAFNFDAQAALALFARAAGLAADLGDRTDESIATANTGLAYFYLGDLARAEARFQQALLWDQASERVFGQMLNHRHLSSLYAAQGWQEQAIAELQTARTLAVELGARDYLAIFDMEIGRSYYDLGDYATARQHLERAMQLATYHDLARFDGLLYVYLGDLYVALGDTARAARFYRKVLAGDGQGSPFGVVWRAELGLARMALAQRQSAQHIAHLKAAVAAIEAEQSGVTIEALAIRFQSNREKLAVYDELILTLAAQGDLAGAFAYAEQARARVLLDQLAEPRAGMGRSIDSQPRRQLETQLQRIQDLQAAHRTEASKSFAEQNSALLSRLASELAEARRAYEEALIHLQSVEPESAALLSGAVSSLAEVQRNALLADATLIEYHVTPQQTLAWVVEQDSIQLVTLSATGPSLATRIAYLRDLVINGQNFDQEVASTLFAELFAPLRPFIHHTNLVIVPHHALHYLPFAMLWDADAQDYLLAAYTVSYAPSASTLKFIAAKRSPNEGRLLALGDPDGSLPSTADEVKTIAKLYGATALVGAQATESQIVARSGRLDVLHIAAHGVLNGYNPRFSAIELHADAQTDGRLEVHEVYDLALTGVNLVVLSACETALGEQSDGDEVVGLNRAFLYAGAPAVVTTQWPIQGDASAALMIAFHRHLRSGMTTAAALRAAQREVIAIDAWANPYYWAAFQLTGDLHG